MPGGILFIFACWGFGFACLLDPSRSLAGAILLGCCALGEYRFRA